MYILRKYRKEDWETVLDIFLKAKPDEMKGSCKIDDIISEVGEKAWLLVAKSNFPAIKLYYKNGFKKVEEFVGKYNGIDVCVLRLALTR